MTLSVMVEIVDLDTLAVDLGQVGRDVSMRQTPGG